MSCASVKRSRGRCVLFPVSVVSVHHALDLVLVAVELFCVASSSEDVLGKKDNALGLPGLGVDHENFVLSQHWRHSEG